jgi:autotransporter-associated beta strand protein
VTLTGNANNFTVGGLTVTNAGSDYTGTPTVTVGGLGGATPTLSSVNLATDSSIGGSGDISISSVISGAGLTKVGAGTLTLSGANTYTGNTTVHGGILKLDTTASIASSASIIVGDAGSSGAHLDATTATGGFTVGLAQTLKGIGTIDGNTTILGTHAPGNSPGLQTFNGNLAYSTGSMVNLELRSNISTDTSGIRGVHFDAVDVIGTGVLSIGTGVTSNLIFNGAGSAVDFASSFWTSDHTWLAYNDVSAPVLDSSWIFDAITASTDSLGASIAASAFSWEQTGNDVFLKFTAVPEPAGVAIGLLCLGVAAFRRRRA